MTALTLGVIPGGASAQSQFQDLHDFGGTSTVLSNGTVGNDGFGPYATAADKSGNVFVLTYYGGLYNQGGLFERTAAGVYKDLHDFGGQIKNAGGVIVTDGGGSGGCVIDGSGNVYGGSSSGGQFNGGMLWELTSAGVYKDLHDFGSTTHVSSGAVGPDGASASTPTLDANGNLFGVCYQGGANSNSSAPSGFGMIWEFTRSGAYKDLHDFGGTIVLSNGKSGADGYGPNCLTIDPRGNLYGTAASAGGGLAYELSNSGAYLDLHDFGATGDGYSPNYVMSDGQGNLFGTCYNGGANVNTFFGTDPGTIWRISASGQYSTLHSFGYFTDPMEYWTLTDGFNPSGPIVMDSLGNLYGTIEYRTWELTSQGSFFPLQDLHAPVPANDSPPEGLAIDSVGNLYGSFLVGGSYANSIESGFLFEISHIAAPCGVTLNPESSALDWVIQSVTVTLSRTSTSDTVVNLSSSSPDLTVQSTVTVPAGQTQATAPAQTYSPSANETVTVTATGEGGIASSSVTLTPSRFLGMSLSTGDDTGATPVTGTLVLDTPAALGGYVVNLTSTNPSVISVPATFTIPAGENQAQFPITIIAQSTTQGGRITASNGTNSYTSSLYVEPLVFQGFTITPTEGQGTTTFTATVSLSRGANGGGLNASIATNSPYVRPPSSVAIPAGVASVSFAVPTAAAGVSSTPLLKATIGTSAKTVSFTLDKTVLPPVLSNLSVSPGEAAGGTTFTGTATLNGPAPTGGTVVSLTTNSPFVSPPATVTVPAGSTSVSFPVNTYAVGSNVTVLLKGTLGTSVKTIYFVLDKTVVAPVLTNLTVSPSEGIGGDQFMATVTLSVAAPTGGTVVALATNSPFVSPPATVTVPAGQTTFTFPVSTSAVSKSVTVLLKATLGSSVRTFYFTLDP